MTARSRLAAGAIGMVLAFFSAAAGATDRPPEPAGYRTEAYRSPTPATLAGATVLSDSDAQALWRERRAVFVDVLPRPKRPADLAPGTLWRDAPHDSIPGAIWLPNTGYGDLAPATEAYFRHGIEAATGGIAARALVFFCQRDCWMSWNAAKRALAAGYTAVHWYPDGTDGWHASGLPLVRVEPVATPASARDGADRTRPADAALSQDAGSRSSQGESR